MDWGWALFIVTLGSLAVTVALGHGHRWPWLALFALNVPWIIYGIETQQGGFIAQGVLYAVVYAYNHRKVFGR